jgi:hypothetical protein
VTVYSQLKIALRAHLKRAGLFWSLPSESAVVTSSRLPMFAHSLALLPICRLRISGRGLEHFDFHAASKHCMSTSMAWRKKIVDFACYFLGSI